MIKIISGILVVLAVVLLVKFNLEMKKASEQFETYQNKAETVETSFGRITYIDEGEGEVILSCHGICGGYDQAYDTLSDKTDTYRVIAPSRFGYPGSDVATNPSIDSQVETFVEKADGWYNLMEYGSVYDKHKSMKCKKTAPLSNRNMTNETSPSYACVM